MSTTSGKSEDTKPFPLSSTLRDLALFRASDIDLSTLLPQGDTNGTSHHPPDSDVESSLERSYEFVREARAVLSVQNKGAVETQGGKVEKVRGELEDVLNGLEGTTC
jgi:hypothetical protein